MKKSSFFFLTKNKQKIKKTCCENAISFLILGLIFYLIPGLICCLMPGLFVCLASGFIFLFNSGPNFLLNSGREGHGNFGRSVPLSQPHSHSLNLTPSGSPSRPLSLSPSLILNVTFSASLPQFHTLKLAGTFARIFFLETGKIEYLI